MCGVAPHVFGDPGRQQRPRHFSDVLPVWCDDAVGQRPERVTGGQRLGLGHVETGATDRAVAQRGDEGVGVDMGAAVTFTSQA